MYTLSIQCEFVICLMQVHTCGDVVTLMYAQVMKNHTIHLLSIYPQKKRFVVVMLSVKCHGAA